MRKINVEEYAGVILSELKKGIFLTTKTDERVNTMVIGWGALGTNWRRPMFTIYVREGRLTREMLDQNPEFTINVPLGDYDKTIFAVCGSKSGRDIDKIKELGLTLVDPEIISVPAIKELPLTLECRIVYRQPQELYLLPEEYVEEMYPQDLPSTAPRVNKDRHVTYYGEIVAAYIAE